jgi:hypothetical protein
MGHQTIVHGRISLRGDFEKTRKFIKTLKKDDTYPWIRTEMFSLGAFKKPYYYSEPIIGFAADYKGLENYWTEFIIKFENLLNNIEFETAKIQIETEISGTFNLFWQSKFDDEIITENKELIEADKWYFGFGSRSRWGTIEENPNTDYLQAMEFKYPIEFDNDILPQFNQILKAIQIIDIGEQIWIKDYLHRRDSSKYNKIYPILIYLQVNKEIEFGSETGEGYWFKKLKEIEEIINVRPR